MTRIVRWNPIRYPVDMLNEFDRLLERPLFPYRQPESWGLALDVAENKDSYLIKASIPGINPDDLEITLEDNVLTIKGEIQDDHEIEKEQYHLRERHYGSFSRSVNFPVTVNGDAVSASYDKGVLTLEVPKAEEVKPKRIAIKSKRK